MNKTMKRLTLALVLCVLGVFTGRAAGWPANYQGVMLQGFYWDSYDDSKWTNLESQADELSQYFKLIWIPNSGKSQGDKSMGYMPIYWFSNHNSSFGTEAQLRNMIKTFKAKGTGIIADVVINHRVGVNDWYDFPTESWNGQSWHIGTDGICSTDEWGRGTGNRDTGEDFNGARDLDHTNANVQNNCKNYCKFLLEDLGYAGFRYDMVKGYSAQYTKMYNEYSGTQFSVGEYWDGSYDAVKAWIDGTGKTSAAFDFPCKYAINKAFSSNNMTELVWKANGTTDQPAGMIHFGYPQYSVTFIDNHDTYRDGNKFTGNVVAANAFILCSPGTPCVFLPHWKQYKTEIAKLISIRNAVGLHNMSAVKVLKSSTDCYMAEVTGTNGKLVVKIGSAMVSPDGYSDSDIKASGNGYCVWSKIGDTPTPPTPPTPGESDLYILGNLSEGGWGTTPGSGVKMTADGTTYTAKGVTFAAASGESKCYMNLTDYVGTTWDNLNMNANRYGSATEGEPITPGTAATIVKYANNVDASGCLSWTLEPGTYDITADLSAMKLTVVKTGDEPTPPTPPTPGDDYYVYFENSQNWSKVCAYAWNDNETVSAAWPGDAMTQKDGKYYWSAPAGKIPTMIIFNNGSDQAKTGDLEYVNKATYDADGIMGDVETVTIVGDYNLAYSGSYTNVHYWGASESKWPGVAMSTAKGSDGKTYKVYKVPEGTTGVIFNNGSSQTGDLTYTGSFIMNNTGATKTPVIFDNGDVPTPPEVELPENLYLIGNIKGAHWDPANPVEMTASGNTMICTAEFETLGENTHCFFNFAEKKGSDWDAEVNQGHRYGATEEGVEIADGASMPYTKYAAGVNASACKSFKVLPGTYDVTVDFKNNTVKVAKSSSIVGVIDMEDENVAPVYYNLQGVRVDNPSNGMFIVVRGSKVTKELVR